MRDLCFIDIETTGSLFGYHEIIEIAAIRTSPNAERVHGTWKRRLRPQHPERITSVAQELTGFDASRWRHAYLSNDRFWSEFVAFAATCVPVCHNPSFERAFISLAASAVGIDDLQMDYHWIGTESLAWPLYDMGHLQKLSLASLCAYLRVKPEPIPHTAEGGANACRCVYLSLKERFTLL